MEHSEKLNNDWQRLMRGIGKRIFSLYKSDCKVSKCKCFYEVKDWTIKCYFINDSYISVEVAKGVDVILIAKYTGSNQREIINCVEQIVNLK